MTERRNTWTGLVRYLAGGALLYSVYSMGSAIAAGVVVPHPVIADILETDGPVALSQAPVEFGFALFFWLIGAVAGAMFCVVDLPFADDGGHSACPLIAEKDSTGDHRGHQ